MRLFFDDADFDGQLQRSIGKADSGMANVGECLAIAQQITPGDRDSWYMAWSNFAGQLAKRGKKALAAGHKVSARNAFLRATEYFRQAFFYHRDRLDGEELRTAYGASVEAFQSALPFLDYQVDRIQGDLFSGYLFANQDGPRPTLLHIGGYDALPKSYTLRCTKSWTEVMPLLQSMVPAREPPFMTSKFRCVRTGRMLCLGWWTNSPSILPSIPKKSYLQPVHSEA